LLSRAQRLLCDWLIFVCIFQRVSVDGSTVSCKSRDEESNISMLLTHGVSSQQFVDLSLPSFRPTYLFLVRIPLDIIHECLKLRLEQRPDKDPTLLSLQSVSHLHFIPGFRHPGMYPKNPLGFFGYIHLKNPPQKTTVLL